MVTIYDSRLKREVKKATLKIFMSKPNDLIDLRFEMADDLTWRSFMFLLRQF